MFMPWDRIKETGVCLSSQYGSSYSIHWMMRVNTIFCFERRSLSFEASQPTWTGRLMVAIRFVLLYVHPRACWHIGLPTTAKEIIIRNCPDVCIFFFFWLYQSSTGQTAQPLLPKLSFQHQAMRWIITTQLFVGVGWFTANFHGKFSRQIFTANRDAFVKNVATSLTSVSWIWWSATPLDLPIYRWPGTSFLPLLK